MMEVGRMDDAAFFDFRLKTFSQLRRASDDVRTALIPALIAQSEPIRDSYFRINRRYFEDDVFLGQMMLRSDVMQLETGGVRDQYYVSTLAELQESRTGRGNAGGFEAVHPRFVELIAARFFESLETVGPFDDEESFLRVLAIADFLVQIGHFSKDGSGRSGEDLLSLLGERHGYPLTFSLTGYRATLGGADHLLFFRHVTQRIFHAEVVRNFVRWLGLDPPADTPIHIRELLERVLALNEAPRRSRLTWPNSLNETIDEIISPLAFGEDEQDPELAPNHPYRLYASFLAREAIYLTLCLSDQALLYPGLLARYPLSMACRALDLREARSLAYWPVPHDSADVGDEAVTRLDLIRLKKLDSDDRRLDQCQAQLAKDAPYLTGLLDTERSTASLETLLERVRLPVRPSMTAVELRDVIRHKIRWSL